MRNLGTLLWLLSVVFAVNFGAHDQLTEGLWSILIGLFFLLGSAFIPTLNRPRR